MSDPLPPKFTRVALLIAAVIACAAAVHAQDNPYRVAEGWPQLPSAMKFGGVISTDVDARGNIWVFHRNDPPILQFAPSGQLLKSFGVGMFVQPHGMAIDRDGNIWVTDAQNKDGKGQQVIKLSPDGKVLMRLGKAGVAAEGPDTFNGPTDVVIAPNGDIFVSDGHVMNANGRIVKFSKDGKFIKTGAKKAKDRVKWIHRMRSPWIHEDGFLWPIARITASRFSTRTESSSTNGSSSAGPAAFPSIRTTRSTSWIRSRTPASIQGSREALESAAQRTARSRHSSPSSNQNQTRTITPAWKASLPIRWAISTSARPQRRS